MIPYKHYSFDLWLTLIKSNPRFKELRSSFFYDQYNFVGKSLEEVAFAFRQVDLMCNAVNERTGKNIDADEMYLMVISLINDNKISLHDIDTDALYLQMEQLVLENLPLIYCNNTAGVLSKLKDRENTTISILSNTGFIKGETLRKVLKTLSIAGYFDFQLYSDEAGLSKPNPAFYQLMLDSIASLRTIGLTDIIHVGDNVKTDYEGALAMGLNALLINSNDIRITELLNHVPQDLFVA